MTDVRAAGSPGSGSVARPSGFRPGPGRPPTPRPFPRRPRRGGGALAGTLLAIVSLIVAGGAVVAARSGFGWDVVAHPVAAAEAAADARPRVAIYGDSLLTQSRPYVLSELRGVHGGARVRLKTFPGTAICDWLGDMARAAHAFHPRAAILEFSGDSLTPCMRDPRSGQPASGAELLAKYRADAGRAMAALGPGVTVYWVSAPVPRDAAIAVLAGQLRAMYAALPAVFANARFVDAAAAVEVAGHFAQSLPCLPQDHCAPGTSSVVVRSPDGAHFCPSEVPGNGACPVWSSGAYRFGQAMAEPVARDLRL